MSRAALTVEPRDTAGGSPAARRLRRSGMVPGILYRSGVEAIPFSVDELQLGALLRHGATLVDVDVSGTSHTSVIKDYQVHPLRTSLLHVDFQEVRMDEVLKSVVTVHLVGEESAPGVKEGGLVNHVTREVNIESTPGNIPEHLEVDISALDTGASIMLQEIAAPSGVTFTDEPETVIATIVVPKAAALEEEVEGEEAAEGEAAAEGGAAESPAAEAGEGGE